MAEFWNMLGVALLAACLYLGLQSLIDLVWFSLVFCFCLTRAIKTERAFREKP